MSLTEFDIKFLTIAGSYNSAIEEEKEYLPPSTSHYSTSGMPMGEIVEYLFQLQNTTNNNVSKHIQEVRKKWLAATIFMKDNVTEGLLSEEPFIRIYAERVYNIKKQENKEQRDKEQKAFFRKKY
jgi:hypothetical protein